MRQRRSLALPLVAIPLALAGCLGDPAQEHPESSPVAQNAETQINRFLAAGQFDDWEVYCSYLTQARYNQIARRIVRSGGLPAAAVRTLPCPKVLGLADPDRTEPKVAANFDPIEVEVDSATRRGDRMYVDEHNGTWILDSTFRVIAKP
jgi:hypothetical protein